MACFAVRQLFFFLSSRIGQREEKGRRHEDERRKEFVIGEKRIIRIVFDQSIILPNFSGSPELFLFFRPSFFSLAETTPLRALAEVRLQFSF
jgi:hypothetical protein